MIVLVDGLRGQRQSDGQLVAARRHFVTIRHCRNSGHVWMRKGLQKFDQWWIGIPIFTFGWISFWFWSQHFQSLILSMGCMKLDCKLSKLKSKLLKKHPRSSSSWTHNSDPSLSSWWILILKLNISLCLLIPSTVPWWKSLCLLSDSDWGKYPSGIEMNYFTKFDSRKTIFTMNRLRGIVRNWRQRDGRRVG